MLKDMGGDTHVASVEIIDGQIKLVYKVDGQTVIVGELSPTAARNLGYGLIDAANEVFGETYL